VEIEFLGVSARDAAAAIARHLGGSIVADDAHAFRIQGTKLGEILVESDLRYLHPGRRHAGRLIRLPIRMAAWLGHALAPVVPRELVVPPLDVDRLPEIDSALTALRSAGASGRGTVLLDSLSMHFNVEPRTIDAGTVTACLKAFLILEPRLRQQVAQGSLRQRLALPPMFPVSYRRRVLAADYWPDLPTLMTDYLSDNPTRKRALDLLPLFAHLDEARIRSILPKEKVSPRPVFHYRLPQAHLSDPGWSVLPDWDRWITVEALAADKAALQAQGLAAVAA
jgi:hypothetical protein